jgi:Domain of unknown function (DUF4440)
MRRLLLLLVPLAGCARPPASSPAPGSESAALIVVAERLFAAMEARDTAAIRATFQPQARIVAVGREGGRTVVQDRGVGEFLAGLAAAPETLRERMWNPEVRIDGDLATLWAPYEFHRGERFSHCGYDAFHFVRVDGAWRVAALSYTRQRDGCPTPPRP